MSQQLWGMAPVQLPTCQTRLSGGPSEGGVSRLHPGPSAPEQQAELYEVWTHLEPETAPGKDASLGQAGCRPEGPSPLPQLLTHSRRSCLPSVPAPWLLSKDASRWG